MEYRISDSSVASPEDSLQNELVGYAAKFNVKSRKIKAKNGEFVEVILPGAFTKTLSKDNIMALWNHDTGVPLGRTGAGTLVLSEDTEGLVARITPPDTQAGRDAVVSIRRGDINKMSFGFDIILEKWSRDETGMNVRQIAEVELYEVSPVTFPAYESTAIFARSSDGMELPIIPEEDRRPPLGSAEAQVRKRRLIVDSIK